MAYTAPAFDKVDFDFTASGYVAIGGGFLLMDMAGGGIQPQNFFFQQVYTVSLPPVPAPDFFFQQAYSVVLDSAFSPPIYPLTLSYNSISTIRYFTEIIANRGGDEQRNISWPTPIYEFDLTQDVQRWEDLNKIISLFKTTKGRELTFLVKDPFDFRTAKINIAVTRNDEFVAIGDGVTGIYNLQKTYSIGNLSQAIRINHPDITTVLIAVDGVLDNATVDPNDGRIFFTNIPVDGAVITAGFEYFRRVRFDSESLSIALENYKRGDTSLNVTEVRGQ